VWSEPGLIIYWFGVGLFYANAPRFSGEVNELINVAHRPRWFVLHADAIDDINYTGGKTLLDVADELIQRDLVFAIADTDPDVLRELGSLRSHREDRRGARLRSLTDARAGFRRYRDASE
jgi:sulfate permease, SulP family